MFAVCNGKKLSTL